MASIDRNQQAEPSGAGEPALSQADDMVAAVLSRIPHSLIAFLGRFSIAAVFWKSGQTKVQGFAIDILEGRFELGIPHFADSTIDLFKEEYRLPFIPPELAALMATVAEHTFPILLLLGLATRLSATGLLGMTLVIQIFVYPGAYPTHGLWATVLLYLMARGGGVFSLDHLVTKRLSP
jgi:putative oxidoreductase